MNILTLGKGPYQKIVCFFGGISKITSPPPSPKGHWPPPPPFLENIFSVTLPLSPTILFPHGTLFVVFCCFIVLVILVLISAGFSHFAWEGKSLLCMGRGVY